MHGVADHAQAAAPEPDWLGRIQPAMRAVAQSGIVEVFNYGRDRQGLIPLWVGEGDSPTPAFSGEAAKASIDRGETFYTHQRGIPELRAAIARYMTRVYGRAPDGGDFSPDPFACPGDENTLLFEVELKVFWGLHDYPLTKIVRVSAH